MSWAYISGRGWVILKRLRDADERLYGRDTLAAYAGEALEFALERTPKEKQQPLVELKAKLGK